MKPNDKRYSLRIKMMAINILITLLTFVLYGGLFVLSISLVTEKYINKDMDFFLTEISDNMTEKYKYMEDMIYAVRDSDVLMNYLKNRYDQTENEFVSEEFASAVNISDSDNQRTEGEPIVEQVYLFRKDGLYVSDFYYSLMTEEIEAIDNMMDRVFKECNRYLAMQNGFECYSAFDEEYIYLACPVMDNNIEVKGIIIFTINRESLCSIMSEVANYERAFWMLYDTNGNVIEGIYDSINIDDIEMYKESFSAPVTEKLGMTKYRLYNNDVGLKLKIMIGIPMNHTISILYDTFGIYIFMLILIFIVAIFSFGAFTYKITKPMQEVTEKIKLVQEGNFDTKLPEYEEKELYEISNGFNRMTSEINHLITEVYEKQILLKEQELKFLQSQLNPHFIFNVLNAIGLQAGMDGHSGLAKIISTFAQFIQAKIYRGDLQKVQIRQELEFAKYYLEIQKFRYGDRLSYQIEVDESLMDYYIQKLCVQIIVENAVVHGLEPKTGSGFVGVYGYEEDGHIVFDIIDDGVGFASGVQIPFKSKKVSKHHNQVGLNNLHSILKLQYGEEYGISIESEVNEGSKVTVRIPFDEGTEEA